MIISLVFSPAFFLAAKGRETSLDAPNLGFFLRKTHGDLVYIDVFNVKLTDIFTYFQAVLRTNIMTR